MVVGSQRTRLFCKQHLEVLSMRDSSSASSSWTLPTRWRLSTVLTGCLKRSLHQILRFTSATSIRLKTSANSGQMLGSLGKTNGLALMSLRRSTMLLATQGGLSQKEVLAVDHFVDAGSDRPDVRLAVVLAVAQNFGSHVEGTSQHGIGVVLSGQQLREPKVCDFDLSLVQQDVCQFEITVHDFVSCKGLKCIEDLSQVAQDLLLRQGSHLTHLGQHVSPVTILQHQVVVVRRLLQSQQLYYVGVVACLQHLYLVLEQLVEFACDEDQNTCISGGIPLIMSLRMLLMATTWRVSWWRPRKTSPNWPFPMTSSRTYLSMTFGIQLNTTLSILIPPSNTPQQFDSKGGVLLNCKDTRQSLLGLLQCYMVILLSLLLSLTLSACPDGSFLNPALGECLVCPPGCLACCDENLCSSCSTGYVLSDTSGLCLSCPPNCDQCKQDLTCLVCNNATSLDNGVCLACPIGCDICPNSSICSVCKAEYYLVSNGCEPCPPGCTACSFSSGYTCSGCSDGYYLSSPNCIACSLPCLYCLGPSSCTACPAQGYFKDGTTCSACPLACSTCSSYTSCSACQTTYFLSGTNCLPCIANCDACPDAITCSTCAANFSLTTSGACSPCSLPCATCASDGSCTSCPISYYLDSGQCIPCIGHCVTCPTAYLCLVCDIGFFFDGTSCTSCGTYCRECSMKTGECTKCLQGFMVQRGSCVPCSDNVCSCSMADSYYSLYLGALTFLPWGLSVLLYII